MMMRRFCIAAFAAVVSAGCASVEQARRTCGDPLRVAVYADGGPGGIGAVEWFRMVHDSPEMELRLVDGKGVREGALEGQDLLIMPGGSSKTEFKTLGPDGVERMKSFIRNGGAYLGTCAGCCLMMDGKDRARVIPWDSRGSEPDLLFPDFTINEAGAKALGIRAGSHKMRYHGGPLMRPTTNLIEGARFELWGTFNAEACFHGKASPEKAMHGAAGVVGGTYGKGRVFVTSAHPEYFESTHYVIVAAIRYLTGRTVSFRHYQRRPGDVAVGFYAKGISGVGTAKTALALSDAEGVDFHPVDNDGIWEGRLRYLDALVVPAEISEKNRAVIGKFEKFVADGGRVYTIGSGRKNAIRGAVACGSADELIREVKR